MIRGVEPLHTSVVILGVASPHGDDAIGWVLLRDWPPPESSGGWDDVDVKLLRNPLQIIDCLDPKVHVVIVDACRSDGKPAEAVIRPWPDPAFQVNESGLSHGLDVAAVLNLADAIGRRPLSLWLFGVEVADCQPGQSLSADLELRLPALRRQLATLVDHLRRDEPAACRSGS